MKNVSWSRVILSVAVITVTAIGYHLEYIDYERMQHWFELFIASLVVEFGLSYSKLQKPSDNNHD